MNRPLFVLFLTAVIVSSQSIIQAAGPAPVNLGSTTSFTILSGAAVTTTGGGTINGNVGASPIAGSAIGVTAAQVNGTIYEVDNSGPAGAVVDPTLLTTAKGDLTTAYNDAQGRSPTPTGPYLDPGSGNLGGLTLVPGLYKFTGEALITGSDVTLTGGPNDVWIFQIASDLQVGDSIQIILAGGARAGNVFWQVGTSATIGTFAVFQGTILASQSVTMNTSSVLDGRALAFTGGVTFDGSSASLPSPEDPTADYLQVTIAPTDAIRAGAQWQVDSGASQNSGATVGSLSPGSHTVSFTTVAGWNTPENQTVTIVSGSTTTASGLYTPSVVPTTGLTLLTNGYGTIQHAAWPKTLVNGAKYTVSGVADAKNVFSSWVGGTISPYATLSTSASYTFTMESGLLLEANFITNPFTMGAGVYNGLFSITTGVTEQTAGMLRAMTIGPLGAFTGTLLINGAAHALAGRFDLTGQSTNHISRTENAGGPLTLIMTLNASGPPIQVTGTVSGTNDGVGWVASLVADRRTNTVPSAEFTMLLPPDVNNAPPVSSPGGYGYLLITNYAGTAKTPASAVASIHGALADGTLIDFTVPVSQDGFVPIYRSLYAGKGLLLGWINLELTNTFGIGLTWIHPARATGFYKSGFTNVILASQVLLSPWTYTPRYLDLFTNLSVLTTISAATPTLNYTLSVSDTSTLREASVPSLVSGSIDRQTGLLKLSIRDGATTITGFGAVLLNQDYAGGYFLSKTNAQAITLAP
jgi:hypothetical protein